MSELPTISEAEWRVMRHIWQSGPLTASELVKRLGGETDWKPKTVRSLLARLLKKGALRYQTRGREYLYIACVTETECAREETRSFVRRVFGGAVTPLVARLIEDGLEADELEKLEKLVAEERARRGEEEEGS